MVRVTLTAVLHKEDDLYVAACPKVGTFGQVATVEAAVANLKWPPRFTVVRGQPAAGQRRHRFTSVPGHV